MKKILTVLLLSIMLTGCSNNSSTENLPVPGDYDFIGPLDTTEIK